jgi:prepilin-type processing-associated H-X9-DG protein
MSFITALATANPPHKLSQEAIAAFMQRSMQLSTDDGRKLAAIFRMSGIETRYSMLEDYGRSENFTFYSNNPGFTPFPSTKKRNEAFQLYAPLLSTEAAQKALRQSGVAAKDITHVITVSCTGMYAPGLDIDLVDSLQLPLSVQRTNINFMGCYAAFNALKAADAFCKTGPEVKVLIVCTELCSLHFQKENTEDNLLANALFADGSAAVIVEANTHSANCLHISTYYSELARQGNKDMAWNIGDVGFEMKLSSYVPDVIRSGIKELTSTLLKKLNLSLENIQHLAIHPGGKRILEAIEQELHLQKTQNQWAYYVLRNYGNMSSPTVLFVLKEIFYRLEKKNNNENILSFAFGPGLTLESMVFTYQHHG